MDGDTPTMRSAIFRFLISAVACLSVAMLSSCVGLKASNANPMPTVSITASPASIFPGQSVSLTWTSANAGSAMIDNGIGASQPSGSVQVSPTEWKTTHIELHLNGRAVLFKTIARDTNEPRGGFAAVPAGLNLAQGMRLLEQSDSRSVPATMARVSPVSVTTHR